jgi:hypothetical protein
MASAAIFGSMLLAAALSGCVTEGETTGELVCDGDFGASAEARRLHAFLEATADLEAAALDIEVDLRAVCEDMGAELAMTDDEIYAGAGRREDIEAVRIACDNVDARLQAELEAIRAAADVRFVLEVEPPRCDVSVDAYVDCVASCEAEVDPGAIDVTCEGGEIRGMCDAACTGSCSVAIDAVCEGRCEGACDGTCSARDDDGSCAGTCDGTCRGHCVLESEASCTGECRGSCSVEMRAPRCTGEVRAPSASIECQTHCESQVSAEATCTRGAVHLSVAGGLDGELQTRADRVIAAFDAGGSALLEIRVRARLARASVLALVEVSDEAASDALSLGATATGCATAAAAQAIDAGASLAVSVSVSVEVSATVSGSAG